MDKLQKLLKKLTPGERERLEGALSALLSRNIVSLDIKKLKGTDDVYRVRTGTLRIIFRKDAGDIRVLDVGRKDDTTYRGS